ncbi:MAG: CAP domain-containing protein, partial [Gloeobacteraceae cyanobacterium ES-bin-316]|nr:CAP domain-containing protein [Ferruginibacter sp.]
MSLLIYPFSIPVSDVSYNKILSTPLNPGSRPGGIFIGMTIVLSSTKSWPSMQPFRFLFTSLVLGLYFSLASFLPGSELEAAVVKETNEYRISMGLQPLEIKKELSLLAQEHSENMAGGRSKFGHGGIEKRNERAKQQINSLTNFGENVAYGAETAAEVVGNWKNSTGHRRNLLGSYKYIGVGIAKNKKGQIFYT